MYILGRTQMIRDAESYEEAIARILACGFDGVEINLYDSDFQPKKEFFQPGFGQKIREFLKEKGVQTYSVGAHLDYTESRERMQNVKDAIRIAHEMGAEVVIINGAHRRQEEPFRQQWEKQIDCMKELGQEAEAYQIRLAVEYEPGFVIHNADLLLQAMEEAGQSSIGVNADIGHFFLEEEEPLKAIEKLGPYIVHAHLENMAAGVHNHLVPYEGDMDLKAYADKLHETGFHGCASLDVYQYDYEEIAEKSIVYLKKYF